MNVPRLKSGSTATPTTRMSAAPWQLAELLDGDRQGLAEVPADGTQRLRAEGDSSGAAGATPARTVRYPPAPAGWSSPIAGMISVSI